MKIYERILKYISSKTKKKVEYTYVHKCTSCGSDQIVWSAYVNEKGRMVGGGMQEHLCLGCGEVEGELEIERREA
tara:strand:- start:1495 stop:1719 length:225 start_codon:yes stop_codon:yes gene_type:complete